MEKSIKRYDVFISHASEDKDNLVRPLATILERLSLNVWYDEFTLKLGDSLSSSIDKGLMDSRYGIVVLSKNFLRKRWPDYEYRSLLSRQIDGENVILPLWYDITKDDVKEYSLYLCDIKGIDISEDNIDKIIPSILQVVRPELWREMKIRAYFRKKLTDGKQVEIKLSDIKTAKSKQSKLSHQQLVRSKAVYYGIGKYLNHSFLDYVDVYELDLVPERELQIWEIMNACYLEMLDRHHEATEDERANYFKILLALSVGNYSILESGTPVAAIDELIGLWEENFYEF